ncbi:MAG: hypothetical protein OQK55_04590 [Thermoanaerobaculales bacterium]|nr:hypothetical protein [Thermoanaerobaculales bacterium]
MNHYQLAALTAAVVLALLIVFQCLLVLGLPFGRAAWGGSHRVLPAKHRWGSAAAVPILGAAAWAVLARARFLAPGPEVTIVRFSVWFFAGYVVLNTVGNPVSKSNVERNTMTPVSTLLVLCFVIVALS